MKHYTCRAEACLAAAEGVYDAYSGYVAAVGRHRQMAYAAYRAALVACKAMRRAVGLP